MRVPNDKGEGEQMSKCITCEGEKDAFSREWGYQQCEPCSINSMVREEGNE